MMRYRYTGTGNNGTFSWLMQRISGLAIAVCGIIVFCQIAFSGSHDIVSWLLLPILLFGIWHTFSGFKMIIDDYVSCRPLRFVLLIIYWALGLAAVALGITFAVM